jgi:hypothetical protein
MGSRSNAMLGFECGDLTRDNCAKWTRMQLILAGFKLNEKLVKIGFILDD